MTTKGQIVAKRFMPADGNLSLFDRSPIELDGFVLTAYGANAVGTPSVDQWGNAFAFAIATHDSSPYWAGDLMSYAEGRADYAARLAQVVDVTGYAIHTVQNLTWICRSVREPERALAPSPRHAAEVASMDVPAQREWLAKATEEGWNSREFRLQLRAHRKRGVLRGQARLEGQYRVIYADPPWSYSTRQPSGTGAQEHYPVMTMDALCRMPIAAHATADAVLFLWVTAPMLYENPGPREVIEAWGFTPKTGMVWDKVVHNFGNYVSVRHEHLLVATRGSCTPDRAGLPDSVITEKRTGAHSEKPEIFRKVIEKLYDGPYLELFARKEVDGWTCYGNEIGAEVQ